MNTKTMTAKCTVTGSVAVCVRNKVKIGKIETVQKETEQEHLEILLFSD
jgi:hypothetical protein